MGDTSNKVTAQILGMPVNPIGSRKLPIKR